MEETIKIERGKRTKNAFINFPLGNVRVVGKDEEKGAKEMERKKLKRDNYEMKVTIRFLNEENLKFKNLLGSLNESRNKKIMELSQEINEYNRDNLTELIGIFGKRALRRNRFSCEFSGEEER